MSSVPGNDTTAAAERFFPGATIESVGDRPWLVSATTDDDRFSVRQLDPRLPATRIELVHEFLGQPALQSATPLVHADRTGSATFDARRWALGQTVGMALAAQDRQTLHLPGSIETGTLGTIARSLGIFHRTGSSPSLVARIPNYRAKDGLTAARRTLELDERALASEIRKESRARRWLTAARPLLANAESNLEQMGFLKDEPPVIAHLDLWGSHIVLSDEDTAMLLDCSTITVAPAAIDLAQLLARNGLWSDERVEQLLNAYTESQPISPLQRRALPWLTALDAVTSCGNLLVRAHDERRPLSDSDRRLVFAAADQQLDLLQVLAAAFVPPPPRQSRRPGSRRQRPSR